MTEELIWKKLSSAWKPEKKDDEISGRILRIEKEVGENKSMLYTLETKEAIKGVWGSTVLDEKMKHFRKGDHVKIIFLGKKEGGKKEDYKDFEVYAGRIKFPES